MNKYQVTTINNEGEFTKEVSANSLPKAVGMIKLQYVEKSRNEVFEVEFDEGSAYIAVGKFGREMVEIKEIEVNPPVEDVRRAVAELFEIVQKPLAYGYGRWLDEFEYEDITDYSPLFQGKVEAAGHEFVKMTKRPWGFQAIVCGRKIHFSVNSSSMGYKEVK